MGGDWAPNILPGLVKVSSGAGAELAAPQELWPMWDQSTLRGVTWCPTKAAFGRLELGFSVGCTSYQHVTLGNLSP